MPSPTDQELGAVLPVMVDDAVGAWLWAVMGMIRPGVSGGFVSRENETYGSGRIEAILG